MTPETAFMAALQAELLADSSVAALVGGKVFDEVPGDDMPGKPPLIYLGPINRQRLSDAAGEAAWSLRARLYAESTDFGRKVAWEIADAAAETLEGATLVLDAPFVCADIVRVLQAGDVFDEAGSFKTVFVDVATTVQRVDA